tara:strand:+ start:160 stop:396 length:237 start_codon:yes stop_codon:yes gene_type:complete
MVDPHYLKPYSLRLPGTKIQRPSVLDGVCHSITDWVILAGPFCRFWHHSESITAARKDKWYSCLSRLLIGGIWRMGVP